MVDWVTVFFVHPLEVELHTPENEQMSPKKGLFQ